MLSLLYQSIQIWFSTLLHITRYHFIIRFIFANTYIQISDFCCLLYCLQLNKKKGEMHVSCYPYTWYSIEWYHILRTFQATKCANLNSVFIFCIYAVICSNYYNICSSNVLPLSESLLARRKLNSFNTNSSNIY